MRRPRAQWDAARTYTTLTDAADFEARDCDADQPRAARTVGERPSLFRISAVF
jgi:hypothetical protein